MTKDKNQMCREILEAIFSLPAFRELREEEALAANPQRTTKDNVKEKVRADFRAVVGKTFLAATVYGYRGDNGVGIQCDPPCVVRVVDTDEDSLRRWDNGWCDPYWNVELLAPHEALTEVCSLRVRGTSYNVETQEILVHTLESKEVVPLSSGKDAKTQGMVASLPSGRTPMIGVRFECGSEARFSKNYGPYEFVQQTYTTLRLPPDGDVELARWVADEGWILFDPPRDLSAAAPKVEEATTWWSDIIIFPWEAEEKL